MRVTIAHRYIAELPLALPRRPWRTRFAPAPTGYLHLGHLVNALFVWGIARAHGGQVLLRLEDHDGTRCKPEFERALLEDLDWMGLHPDIGTIASFRDATPGVRPHVQRQSDNGARYAAALAELQQQGLVYPCVCTRRAIAERSPHIPGEEPRYPGTCGPAGHPLHATLARRVRMYEERESFTDLRCGDITQHPSAQCGDLLVRDRHGQWTYQFAVVVDDLAHDIDVIIRGEDLLASTGRQRRVARLLGRTRPLAFLHHPLITHPNGRKLSKANRDTSLRERRAQGATPAVLLGEAAFHAGLLSTVRELSVEMLPPLFILR